MLEGDCLPLAGKINKGEIGRTKPEVPFGPCKSPLPRSIVHQCYTTDGLCSEQGLDPVHVLNY